MIKQLFIAKSGTVTAVGGDTAMTTRAVNAEINAVSNSAIYNRRFNAMKLAAIPSGVLLDLHPKLQTLGLPQKQARMICSCSHALRQCLQGLTLAPPPLFLALPESPPGLAPFNFTGLLQKIATQSELPFDIANSRTFELGRAGGMHALTLAFRYIEQTGEDFVLIGGVDSPLDHRWLSYLDYQQRLLSYGTSDAFAPGEGACCLLIASDAGRRRLGLDEVCSLQPPGIAQEPGHVYSTQPNLGRGLSSAVAQALAAQPLDDKIEHLITTLNGEHYWAKELGIALTRNNAHMAPSMKVHHPADCFGDLGAAFTAVLLATTAANLLDGRLQGSCLVYGASDTEHRGSVVIQRHKH